MGGGSQSNPRPQQHTHPLPPTASNGRQRDVWSSLEVLDPRDDSSRWGLAGVRHGAVTRPEMFEEAEASPFAVSSR